MVVGADGGTVTSDDGSVSLVIPSAALDEPVEISITAIADRFPDDSELELLGSAYALEPDGLVFAQPVTLSHRLELDTVRDDEGFVPSAVPLLVSSDGVWDTGTDPRTVADLAGGTLLVTATIDHFTNYMSAKGPLWVLVIPVESPQEKDVVWPVSATVWNKRAKFSLQINFALYGSAPPPMIEQPLGARHTDFILEPGKRQVLDAPVPRFKCVRAEGTGTYQIDVNAEFGGDFLSPLKKLADTVFRRPTTFDFLVLEGMECASPSAPEATVTVTQVHPGGTEQVSEGHVVGEPGAERAVAGGTYEVYVGTWPGSTVWFNIHGPAGAIPHSDRLDRDTARTIADAFDVNIVDQPDGGPTVDWPAVFAALGITPGDVCGGRVTLDIDADQGGRLPGFAPDGTLNGTGAFVGEAGTCDDFPIDLRAQITER